MEGETSTAPEHVNAEMETIRMQLLDGKTIDKVIPTVAKLLVLFPDAIAAHNMHILALTETQAEVTRKIKRWEIDELSQIMGDMDGDNKPIYSNETKRKAELENRKIMHDGYCLLRIDHENITHTIQVAKIDLEHAFNRFSSVRNIARMIANRNGG